MKNYLKAIAIVFTVSLPLALIAHSLTSNPYADILNQKYAAEQRELEAVAKWHKLQEQINPLTQAQAALHSDAEQARKAKASLEQKAQSLATGNPASKTVQATFTQPTN